MQSCNFPKMTFRLTIDQASVLRFTAKGGCETGVGIYKKKNSNYLMNLKQYKVFH